MTAKIKLNAASGGGSVSLKAPSTTTSNAANEGIDVWKATIKAIKDKYPKP